MDFLVFTYVGIAAAIAHTFIPSEHRVGAASSFALGVGGAWAGALLAGTLVRGGWAAFGMLQFAGSVVGSIATIAVFELVTERYKRREAAEEAA
jgi:uncharacterized membrane protein YeaQ/YmgE (transglycosylase-associated protein family)